MSRSLKSSHSSSIHQLSVEIGGWFKAHASGAGVIAIPIVLGLVIAAWLVAGRMP